MKFSTNSIGLLGLGVLGAIAAWTPATAATAEEKAKCEQMIKQMGTAAPHDHGMEKSGAPNAMTTEHVRCKEILGEAGKADKKEGSAHEHNK